MGFDWDKMFNENKAITEPTADLRIFAGTNWQCYQAHLAEGFTPDQSMSILMCVISTILMRSDYGKEE